MFAILFRILYCMIYSELVFKRLDIVFGFPTQIRFINNFMLFWSLSGVLLTGLLKYATESKVGANYSKELLAKWLLSYLFFMVFYWSFAIISGTKEDDFDPSGHIACSYIAQTGHCSYRAFMSRRDKLSQEDNFGEQEAGIVEKVA